SQIRAQVARTETFRGFRSATVGFSGLLGVLAAFVQSQRVPHPSVQVQQFVELWVGVATISLVVVGAEMACRWMVESSSLKRRLTVLAIQQFAPCLVAGAIVTLIIANSAPESAWMFPGLWAVLFSLGVFSCCRVLPIATVWVGVYYLASGAVCLALGNGPRALSPWSMAGTFGVGQLLAASILHFTLERSDEQLEA
ncbi:MAG: hypothetical protein KF861_07015, partial [Planctomycetaceae bacterium]|nr:hypothetical protein [Planctomycetaceae bacterium]